MQTLTSSLSLVVSESLSPLSFFPSLFPNCPKAATPSPLASQIYLPSHSPNLIRRDLKFAKKNHQNTSLCPPLTLRYHHLPNLTVCHPVRLGFQTNQPTQQSAFFFFFFLSNPVRALGLLQSGPAAYILLTCKLQRTCIGSPKKSHLL